MKPKMHSFFFLLILPGGMVAGKGYVG